MLKVKQLRTADCVVGGFRYAAKGGEVGSLLLGLYDEAGKLDHVGFTSAIPAGEKAALTRRLEALVAPPGFTGNAPGGPSRWSTERTGEWVPLRPELVAEVRYDHVTGDRFRHGTKFLRWRPDKAPEQCRMDQLRPEAAPAETGFACWSRASEAALIIRLPVSSAASAVSVTATPSGPSTMTMPCSALTSLGSEWDVTDSMTTSSGHE